METPEASLRGAIALCGLKPGDEEARAVAAAVRRRAVAAILYREEVPELYSATVTSGTAPIPRVTIRSADGWRLAEDTPEIELRVDATPSRLLGENLLVELGEGTRPLPFLAHYDTRPGTPGAFRNASGVTVLLGLLARLRGWEAHPLIWDSSRGTSGTGRVSTLSRRSHGVGCPDAAAWRAVRVGRGPQRARGVREGVAAPVEPG